MARKSPLLSKSATAVSACGKILQKGQSVVVKESAVGPREKLLEKKGRLRIRPSNKKGHVQLTCTL